MKLARQRAALRLLTAARDLGEARGRKREAGIPAVFGSGTGGVATAARVHDVATDTSGRTLPGTRQAAISSTLLALQSSSMSGGPRLIFKAVRPIAGRGQQALDAPRVATSALRIKKIKQRESSITA